MHSLTFRRPCAQFALVVFLCLFLPTLAQANGKDRAHRDRDEFYEEFSEGLGVAALWGLALLNGLYYYSMGLRLVRARSGAKRIPEAWKIPLRWKGKFRNYHYWGNPLMIAVGYWHGIWAEEGNPLLWVGWGLLVMLALSGLTMKLQGADQPGARLNRLIHTQHFLAFLMVGVLWAGHLLAD